MTHVRILEGTYLGTLLLSLGCLAFSVLFGIGGAIGLSILTQKIQDGEQIMGSLLLALLSLVGMVGCACASYGGFTKAFWIELGDRLTYRTLRGVYTHEWHEIESLQFNHKIVQRTTGARYPGLAAISNPGRQNPSAVVWFEPSTQLVISFANGKQIFETLGRRHGLAEKLLRALIDGLRCDDPCTRRRVAEALRSFRPDAMTVGWMARWWSAEGAGTAHAELVRAAETKAKQLADRSKLALCDARLELEQTTKDTVADVRRPPPN